MGIKKSQSKWSSDELQFLKDNWGAMGGKVCSRLKGHTEKAVREKAKELKLKRNSGRYARLSDEEIAFLKENADTMTVKDMAEHLERPFATVSDNVYRTGLRGKKRGLL